MTRLLDAASNPSRDLASTSTGVSRHILRLYDDGRMAGRGDQDVGLQTRVAAAWPGAGRPWRCWRLAQSGVAWNSLKMSIRR